MKILKDKTILVAGGGGMGALMTELHTADRRVVRVVNKTLMQ